MRGVRGVGRERRKRSERCGRERKKRSERCGEGEEGERKIERRGTVGEEE